MPNPYFQFKQFTIFQDKTAMKVCTDACILGAWAADVMCRKAKESPRYLDIGTGTGLLSLMLAQKTTAFIDAVEVEENAFKQAGDNFKRSKWKDHLKVFHTDAKNITTGIKYDFIICNPPFYENDLLSPLKITNVARHGAGLKLDELIIIIKKNLNASGSFAVLLPYQRIPYFEEIAEENHFFLQEKLLVKPTSRHHYFRGVLLLSQINADPVIKELVIKNNGHYTADFVSLMQDYYLNV